MKQIRRIVIALTSIFAHVQPVYRKMKLPVTGAVKVCSLDVKDAKFLPFVFTKTGNII